MLFYARGLIMNMQKKTIVFFSTCIIFVCFVVAFLGYRNAVNGFEESLTDQAKDAGTLFNSLVENAYAENTKDAFGVRYAFFKEATDNSDDRKVKGFARYSSKTVDIDGISYWITNDIYKRNLPKIVAWVASFK